AFSYYLQEGNSRVDYACRVRQCDEAKEGDEPTVLGISIINEHALMAYMGDPSNCAAPWAREGRVCIAFKKATADAERLLLEAQLKERPSVLSAKAARVLSRQGVDLARLLRCRFALTWEWDERGNAPLGMVRLVVLGLGSPDLPHLRTESPVASRRARQFLLTMAARQKWALGKAFGMSDDQVMQFLRPMCGSLDAPRKWWFHFEGARRKLELEAVQCEPCVWAIRDGVKLVGVVTPRADDMLNAGDHASPAFLKKRTDSQKSREWTPLENRAFVLCGTSIIHNDDVTCSLVQDNYSLNVEPIKQSAPWLSAEASLLQAGIPTATIPTMQKINELTRAMNDVADVVMLIPAIDQIAVVGWGDAAQAARATGESQGGEIVALAPL
ncbi:unnamed protein product, partial [Prorocentrum cordatum]